VRNVNELLAAKSIAITVLVSLSVYCTHSQQAWGKHEIMNVVLVEK
jgi:hypothetical protein